MHREFDNLLPVRKVFFKAVVNLSNLKRSIFRHLSKPQFKGYSGTACFSFAVFERYLVLKRLTRTISPSANYPRGFLS